MINSRKKGFTLVELVIVIAVVAILAAVLIPTFSSLIKKANVSNDTALVKNLNTALVADVDGHETMSEVLEAAKEFGYDIAKIQAKADKNKILWDSKNDCFVYLDSEKGLIYIPDSKKEEPKNYELWVISDKVDAEYSTYLYGYTGATVEAKHGLDVGECAIEEVTYTTNATETVVINTNGGVLVIDAENATVNHYGNAQEVYVNDVAAATYNLYGNAGYIEVASGEHVVLKQASSVSAIVVNGEANVEISNGQKEDDIVYDSTQKDEVYAAATKFGGGLGTADKPYIISNVEHMENINDNYEKAYYYYKVADGIKLLDLSNYSGAVELNGSFDGNNVTFINAQSYIFKVVGTGNEEDTKASKLSNFEVKFEGGKGVVRNCGATILEFDNVNVSGYIVSDWNVGAFLRYGSNNVNDNGFDYTVNFKNCSSKAEIYASANSFSAILIGHTYPGVGKTATINVDKYTDENVMGTTLYFTGTDTVPYGFKYCGAGTNEIFVDGQKITQSKLTGNNIVKIDSAKTPSKADNGKYEINVEGDTSKVVVSLVWQYTLYTENYEEKIADQSGVGGQLGENITIEIDNEEKLTVLEAFNSVEIVTGSDKFDYEIKNGKLVIYMLTENKFVDGDLRLTVEQFTSSNQIAKYKGTVTIASNKEGTWK